MDLAVVEETKAPAPAVVDLDQYNQVRKTVMDFVASELREGVDYGKSYDRATKDVLLKPGAEKIAILLRLEPVFVKDADVFSMIGKEGRICMICFLMTHEAKMAALEDIGRYGKDSREEIYRCYAHSEGRGCGNLGEKKNTVDNVLIKMVEKRAQVDATLRIASLSDIFTQDMEEMTDVTPRRQEKTEAPKASGKTLTTATRKAMENSRDEMVAYAKENKEYIRNYEKIMDFYNAVDIKAEEKWKKGDDPMEFLRVMREALEKEVRENKDLATF